MRINLKIALIAGVLIYSGYGFAVEPNIAVAMTKQAESTSAKQNVNQGSKALKPEVNPVQVDAAQVGDPPLKKRAKLVKAKPFGPMPHLSRPFEFKAMVETSIGYPLSNFGEELFSADAELPPLAAGVGSDYVLGSGDELIIRTWDGIEMEHRGSVDSVGNFHIPKVGSVFLAGSSMANAETKIRNAFRTLYKQFQLSLDIGQLKAIQIYVVGQVAFPGSYQVSPLATGLSALLAAGGPTELGTYRKVQIKRNNKVISELDLYDLIINGDNSADVQLRAGDVIHVPYAGAKAAIAGGINVPAIYELKTGDSVQNLVEYASGYAATANPSQIMLEKVQDGKYRTVTSVSNEGAKSLLVTNGDLILVPHISMEYANAVTLRGAVANAMRHPWVANMRVSDILPNKEALITPNYWTIANTLTYPAPLGQNNMLKVAKPYTEINWNYATIERLNRDTLQMQIIPFNLGEALLKNPAQDLALVPGDILTVYSQKELEGPQAKINKTVRLEGEVVNPGVYTVLANDTLVDVIARAGGLTKDAYLYGAIFTRQSVQNQQQAQLKEFADTFMDEVERTQITSAQDSLSPEDVAASKLKADAQRNIAKKLANTKASGRLILEVPFGSRGLKDIPKLALEDQDRLVIPTNPTTVSVIGQVYTESTFVHKAGKSVQDYVEQAGGPLGKKNSIIYVARADGTISRASDDTEVNPGDSIAIMDDLSRKSLTKSIKDWTQILYQFGLGAAAFNSLK